MVDENKRRAGRDVPSGIAPTISPDASIDKDDRRQAAGDFVTLVSMDNWFPAGTPRQLTRKRELVMFQS